MRIYQLHQYGGEWEDAFDYIVGSYVRKERAEEDMAKHQAEDEIKYQKSLMCNRCPLSDAWSKKEIEAAVKKCIADCKNFAQEKDEDDVFCANWTSFYDKPSYVIKEVNVEE